MPNWCTNHLEVEGPEKSIKKMLKAHWSGSKTGGYVPDFDKIIPYPAKFKRQDKKAAKECKKLQDKLAKMTTQEERVKYLETHPYPKNGFNSGGYEWCCNQWGTKWPAGDVCSFTQGVANKKEKTAYISVSFDTAWAPPIPVLKKLAELYPELYFRIKYMEEGNAIYGIADYNG